MLLESLCFLACLEPTAAGACAVQPILCAVCFEPCAPQKPTILVGVRVRIPVRVRLLLLLLLIRGGHCGFLPSSAPSLDIRLLGSGTG